MEVKGIGGGKGGKWKGGRREGEKGTEEMGGTGEKMGLEWEGRERERRKGREREERSYSPQTSIPGAATGCYPIPRGPLWVR